VTAPLYLLNNSNL